MISLILILGFVYADIYKNYDNVASYATFLGHAVGEKRIKALTETASINLPVVIPKKKKSFEEKIEELEKILLEKWFK